MSIDTLDTSYEMLFIQLDIHVVSWFSYSHSSLSQEELRACFLLENVFSPNVVLYCIKMYCSHLVLVFFVHPVLYSSPFSPISSFLLLLILPSSILYPSFLCI